MQLPRSHTTVEQALVGKREHFNSEDTASVKAQNEAASVSILGWGGPGGKKKTPLQTASKKYFLANHNIRHAHFRSLS